MYNYVVNSMIMDKTTAEKDLGILVDSRLNFSNQCQVAAAKADKNMGCIKRPRCS